MSIRWLVVAAVVLSACAGAQSSGAALPAGAPGDAVIQQRSRELLDAFDRGDRARLRATLAPSFVQIDNQHVTTSDELLGGPVDKPPHPPIMTRTWKSERVFRRDSDALFIGNAIEHETGNDSHGNRKYDGWYTITWVRDRDGWKATHTSWTPNRSSLERKREVWNDNYRQGVGFDARPNRLLVDSVRGVPPGAALDVMMGQGRNAIYLASQGWRVTGIDISDEGLRIARDTAARDKLELTTLEVDAETYDYGVAKWDLVTMIYAGDSAAMIEKIKPSIKPGGMFVLEFFGAEPGTTGNFARGQLAKLFGPGFEIVRDDFVDDVPDWARDRAKLVRFVARKMP